MIVFVHLLNDRSGSPRVLQSVMSALKAHVPEQLLYLGEGGDGFLSDTTPDARRYVYRRRTWRLGTLFSYLRSQLSLASRLWRSRDIASDASIYVNTLLPFAAALFGRLTGRRVICHLHEASVRPWLLRWLLLRVVILTADRVICVSQFQRRALGLPQALVVPNAVDAAMHDRALSHLYMPRRQQLFRVCMLCSLRDYKGVPEFLRLAHSLSGQPDIHFELVVSDGTEAVAAYFAERACPGNVTVVRGMVDTGQAYAGASLVVNLSRVDICVETFGLTLLEAMAFGVPVIAPPVGGPSELVQDGVQGYLIDSRDGDALRAAVLRLAGDDGLCARMSEAGRSVARLLSPDAFQAAIQQAVLRK